MHCNKFELPGGGYAIVCGTRRKMKACVTCGLPSSLLCDFPVTRDGKATTCDRPCCQKHVEHVGPDKDYCLAHARFAEAEQARQARIASGEETACRVCGCSESKACPGGCYWAEPDLCSACAQKGAL